MPDKSFNIIAGPNGAGKSTTSKYLFPDLKVYDGDIELARIKHDAPSYASDEYIYGRLYNVFNGKKNEAIQSGASFAMETNFSTSTMDLKDLIQEFKTNNYKIKLYYIGLDDFNDSVSRVVERVSKGGHDVPLHHIKHNFEMGIKNTNECINLMNEVRFYENGKQGLKNVAKIIEKDRQLLTTSPPDWFTDRDCKLNCVTS